jgi:glycosyltransferase involved in cell wall biosynthesis
VIRRLVILTEIISPYRIPLFNALTRRNDVDLHVIFLAETDPGLRQWLVYKNEIQFSYEILPSWRTQIGHYNVLLNRGIWSALNAAHPHAILCGGYNYVASWQTLLWARTHSVPILLWSESHQQEQRRTGVLVEFMKTEFIQRCNGFVVPGQMATEYLRTRRIKPDVIFTAPNAVDNDLFASAAADARANAATRRHQLNLPGRYILFVGRLVREKGVFELLAAYAKLNHRIREQVGLVFAGDGVARSELEKQAVAISPGTIRFPGFVHREQLATLYALAEMLVLPTYTDTWGLVVNEAMACGLPVILSRAAGCAPDLIKESWNGLLIPPTDVPLLAAAMESLATQPDVCAKLGAHSAQHISHFSSEAWSAGIVEAVDALGGTRA